MEEKHLRSMKACVIDISMQVDNIMDTIISEAHYQCLRSEREIIKEALEELNRIVTVCQSTIAVQEENKQMYKKLADTYKKKYERAVYICTCLRDEE